MKTTHSTIADNRTTEVIETTEDDSIVTNEDLVKIDKIESIGSTQKKVLGILERLVSERSKPKIKLIVEILTKHGYFATKTNRGLLVNIRELSRECLVEICNEFP